MSLSRCAFSDTQCNVKLTFLKGVHGVLNILSTYFIFWGGEGRGEVGAADVHENLLSFGCVVKIGSPKAIRM